jgi:hypothetical protein
MSAIRTELITKIEERVHAWGGYSACNVGVTNDLERRLFSEHRVDRDKPSECFCVDVGTFLNARAVEDYFVARGCSGARGGGDVYSTIVYAYRMTGCTEP